MKTTKHRTNIDDLKQRIDGVLDRFSKEDLQAILGIFDDEDENGKPDNISLYSNKDPKLFDEMEDLDKDKEGALEDYFRQKAKERLENIQSEGDTEKDIEEEGKAQGEEGQEEDDEEEDTFNERGNDGEKSERLTTSKAFKDADADKQYNEVEKQIEDNSKDESKIGYIMDATNDSINRFNFNKFNGKSQESNLKDATSKCIGDLTKKFNYKKKEVPERYYNYILNNLALKSLHSRPELVFKDGSIDEDFKEVISNRPDAVAYAAATLADVNNSNSQNNSSNNKTIGARMLD